MLLLDFLHPERSHRWNPLANVRDSLDAELFAETWVANTGTGKERFWEALSKLLIANAALHLVRTAEGWPPTLAELRDLLCGASLAEVLAIFAGSPVPEVCAGAAGLAAAMEQNERMQGAAFAELQNRLRATIHAEIEAVTAANEIDLAQFGRRPTALYIRFDLNRTELLAPLTAVFYAQLFDTLMRQATASRSGRLDVPVLLYLDEFGNIGTLPGVQQKMAQLRSYGIGFFLVLQNLAQLVDTYGEAAAKGIVGNCWTRICLAGVGPDDAEVFSDLVGARTVLAASQGDSREITRLPWAGSGNRGIAETARPLMTPDELRRMAGRVLIVAGSRRPLLARATPYYRDPLLRSLVPGKRAGDPLADFTRAPGPPPGAGATAHAARNTLPPAASPVGSATALSVAPAASSRQAAPATPAAPAPVGAPVPKGDGAAAPRGPGAAPRWSGNQAAVLAALAAAGRPGAEVSSTDVERATGLPRAAVRRAFGEIRGKLGLEQRDDIIACLRARGLPVPAAPASPAPAAVGSPLSGRVPAVTVVPVAPPDDGAAQTPPGDGAAVQPTDGAAVGLSPGTAGSPPRLTPAEEALLGAIVAAPAAGPTGWAAELGVSASRVRGRLTELREKLALPEDVPAGAIVRAARGGDPPAAPPPARSPDGDAPAGGPGGAPGLDRGEAEALAVLAADPTASGALLGLRLGVGSGTVRKRLDGVRARLGVGREVEGAALVALARERGLLPAAPGAGGRLVAFRPRPAEEG